MPKLVWDQAGTRKYENGVSKGVLFPVKSDGSYDAGVAWNGLVSVSESPSGAEPSAVYADNIKYLDILSAEEFAASIEAYMYPDEFAVCDGSAEIATGVEITQQPRSKFALCYRTEIGTDANPSAGYKLHIIYGALAAPTEKSHETINESPEAMTMSWEISTTPVEVTGFKPTAHLVIDSTKVDSTKLASIEDSLYGDDMNPAALLLPSEVLAIINA